MKGRFYPRAHIYEAKPAKGLNALPRPSKEAKTLS
jgi:hypothetical protein